MENTLEKASNWAPGVGDSGERGPKSLGKINTSQPSGQTEIPKGRLLKEDWGMTLVIAEAECGPGSVAPVWENSGLLSSLTNALF